MVLATKGATATGAATAKVRTAAKGGSGELGEPVGDLLVGILKESDEGVGHGAVLVVEEGRGTTNVSSATGTTDAMNVVVNVGGKVVVDNVHDVGDVEATGGDGGGDEDGANTGTEGLEGLFTLGLGAVTVDAGAHEAGVVEEIVEELGVALGLHKYQSQGLGITGGLAKDIDEGATLLVLFDEKDLLDNVLTGGTNTAHSQEDIVTEEVRGEFLDLTGEGGGEHEGLALTGQVETLDDLADLGLKAHVEHTIGLIENEPATGLETDLATTHHVQETAGSGDEDITSFTELTELQSRIGTTVDDTGMGPGAISELAGLFIDLKGELTSGGHDEGLGHGRALVSTGLDGNGVLEDLGEDGEEKGARLTGTSLSTGHQITVSSDHRDAVLLNGSGHGEVGNLNVVLDEGVEIAAVEAGDGLGDIVARGRDGDIVVLVKVDTSADCVTKEMLLDGGVPGEPLEIGSLGGAGSLG